MINFKALWPTLDKESPMKTDRRQSLRAAGVTLGLPLLVYFLPRARARENVLKTFREPSNRDADEKEWPS